MSQKIIIAIDGYSSCGKSTLAKALAKHLNYSFIDTGAMYRAVTLYFIQNNIAINEANEVTNALNNIALSFKFNPITGKSDIYLNGVCVEEEIREMYVANKVSDVAAIKAVREFAVAQQQKMGAEKGIVMDGRDIGTVVFPNAELKIFMTADPEVRVQRRLKELLVKGQAVNEQEVRENLKMRDHIDTTRAESPLRQAEDAIVLDNSHYTMEQQLQIALDWVKERI